VGDVYILKGFDLSQIQTERFKRAFEFTLRAASDLAPGLGAAHVKISVVGTLIAPAMDLYFNLLRQFAAQVIHVNACAAIDVWRVLAGK
jgi:hypothetical protein